MQPNVEIKGIREGLLVNLGDGEWDDIQASLLDNIDQQAEFLKDARIAIDVGNHILKAVELSRLRDAISERGLTLWAVISSSPMTEQTAQTLGLATRLSKPRPERDMHTLDTTIQGGEQAVLVQRTLRSGYSLVYPGHIVIIGDVNPGAQVTAGGNVIVWGRLRGVVHAGAEGDEEAIICALDLTPTQLRIAEQIAIPPKRRGKPQPEVASLQDGQVTAEQWNPKKVR